MNKYINVGKYLSKRGLSYSKIENPLVTYELTDYPSTEGTYVNIEAAGFGDGAALGKLEVCWYIRFKGYKQPV